VKEKTYIEHVSEWLYHGLKVVTFPGGLLLHMQCKLYKPPANLEALQIAVAANPIFTSLRYWMEV